MIPSMQFHLIGLTNQTYEEHHHFSVFGAGSPGNYYIGFAGRPKRESFAGGAQRAIQCPPYSRG